VAVEAFHRGDASDCARSRRSHWGFPHPVGGGHTQLGASPPSVDVHRARLRKPHPRRTFDTRYREDSRSGSVGPRDRHGGRRGRRRTLKCPERASDLRQLRGQSRRSRGCSRTVYIAGGSARINCWARLSTLESAIDAMHSAVQMARRARTAGLRPRMVARCKTGPHVCRPLTHRHNGRH